MADEVWRRPYEVGMPLHRLTPGTPAPEMMAALRWTIPRRLIDFGYRAVHEMTVQAKAIIAAYYGNAPAAVVLERLLDRRSTRD